ncbi:MAG: histidine kinase dimerization/phospho-acceptor domain-containing protein [Candidatus Omnitrophota bacterium]
MEDKNKATEQGEHKAILEELEVNSYRRFNIAFALMSVIPFLVFFYLLTAWFFTIEIFVGTVGLMLVVSIFIAVCGLFIGYGVLKKLLRTTIDYAAKAQKYSELKSTFVAHVSHDFRNPLYALSSSIKEILEGMPDQIGEEAKKTLENCQAEMDRMWDLSTHLLDVYEIDE